KYTCSWKQSKTVGPAISDGTKFSDVEAIAQGYRKMGQLQVCYDSHVHGLQVKWVDANGTLLSGSQHFSSRFSSKNIDIFILGSNEYINHVSGRFTTKYTYIHINIINIINIINKYLYTYILFCFVSHYNADQWINQLVIRTNFGRTKRFGQTLNGEPFDLDIPCDAEVIGFAGSYSAQLYTLAALYRPAVKPEKNNNNNNKNNNNNNNNIASTPCENDGHTDNETASVASKNGECIRLLESAKQHGFVVAAHVQHDDEH
ncbi:hypothetical protein RFI_16288, partial [Reticulomyxa filosa]